MITDNQILRFQMKTTVMLHLIKLFRLPSSSCCSMKLNILEMVTFAFNCMLVSLGSVFSCNQVSG